MGFEQLIRFILLFFFFFAGLGNGEDPLDRLGSNDRAGSTAALSTDHAFQPHPVAGLSLPSPGWIPARSGWLPRYYYHGRMLG